MGRGTFVSCAPHHLKTISSCFCNKGELEFKEGKDNSMSQICEILGPPLLIDNVLIFLHLHPPPTQTTAKSQLSLLHGHTSGWPGLWVFHSLHKQCFPFYLARQGFPRCDRWMNSVTWHLGSLSTSVALETKTTERKREWEMKNYSFMDVQAPLLTSVLISKSNSWSISQIIVWPTSSK